MATAVAEVVAILNHLDEERLPSRHVEGVYGTLERSESNDFPEIDNVRQSERRHGQRLNSR